MMEQNQKLESIASHVAKTFESFRGLEDALTETDSFDGSSKGAALRELLPTVENDFTRFKMWAGNQAAHQSGPFSLDCRLKEAPHLQQQVIHLLIDICESLQDALSKTFATPDPLNQDQERGRDHQNTQNKEASSANSARDRESEFSDSDSDLGSGTATVAFSTLVLDVGEAIDCLLRLSVAIANPATHEHFQKLGVGPSEDVSFYEPHDIAYVRDKFPKISDKLANTLGRYITRRRQSFKYLQAHHEELPSSAKTLASNNEADTFYTEVVPRSFTSSLTRPFETLATFDPQASVIDEDIRSDSGISERSYITSDGSTFEGTDQETHKPAPLLRVPPRPSAAEDGTFECPFCYKTISAGTRTEWKQHVFGDLRPYICVFSNCTNSNIDFGRLHNWQLHFSKYHWRSWSCPFECQQPLSSAEELSSHIKDQHFPSGTEGEIKLVTTLGEKPASEDTSGHCLLCGHSVTGLEKYIKHVGRHLEQLALFALPNFEIENPKRESESKEQNSVKFGTGAKNVCKICRGVFTTKSNLKRHEDRNHGEWDWHDELDRFSTGLFPILEPQKQPSPDLPVEEENEKEEIDFYGPNKNPENPQGLSEKAKGKLPTTQKSWEDTQQQTESPNTIQDMKLSRTMDSKSEYGKFPDYTPWSKGDMPSLEDFIEDSERIHDMLSGQNISASTVDLVEPLSPSLKYRLEDSANQILDGSIWNLENENENSWFGFDKDEWIMDITGQARGVSPGKAHPYQRPLPPLPSQNKAAEVAGEMFDTTSERQRDSDLQLQSEVHPPQVKLTPITRQLAAPSTRYQASYNCDECPKTFSREVHLRRHKLSHSRRDLFCPVPECRRTFHRQDLLNRHISRHADRRLGLGPNNVLSPLIATSGIPQRMPPMNWVYGSTALTSEQPEAPLPDIPAFGADISLAQPEHSLPQIPLIRDEREHGLGTLTCHRCFTQSTALSWELGSQWLCKGCEADVNAKSNVDDQGDGGSASQMAENSLTPPYEKWE